MKEKYPEAMDKFCKWIDEYKKVVSWDRLFNAGLQPDHSVIQYKEVPAPKFHDLPLALQLGIVLEYLRHEDKELPVFPIRKELMETIEEFFKYSTK